MFAQLAHHLGFESASKYSYSMSSNLKGHLQVWSREIGSPKQQTKPAQRSDPRDVLSSGLYFNLQRDTEQWREGWFRTMKIESWATVQKLVSLSAKTPSVDEMMLSERTRVWVSGREKERERDLGRAHSTLQDCMIQSYTIKMKYFFIVNYIKYISECHIWFVSLYRMRMIHLELHWKQ